MSDTSPRFPRTSAALSSATIAHLIELEAAFTARGAGAAGDAVGGEATPQGAVEFDVAIAGGGLSLLYGARLARAGHRVVVLDRRRIGEGHREWNISRAELRPLVDSGLFTAAEVAALVRLEYDHGIVRWHGGRPHAVRNVLDCVIAAAPLLSRLRQLALTAGATLLDGHRLAGTRSGRHGITLAVDHAAGRREITARLLLDATGAASQHAAFDLVCPTVGGVFSGLATGPADDEVDARVGEILASTEGVEEGRQHIWEGFPGEDGRYTIYLFYYAEPDTLGEAPLQSLYERFFRVRERYKRGDARLERPTYGFIPAYTRLRPTPTAPADRLLLVGDAASRHSPLTFCGFGSMIRSFLPISRAIEDLLARDRLARADLARVWREPPVLGVMGGLTLMMIPPGGRGRFGPSAGDEPAQGEGEINRLLDTAFGTLAELGDETYGAFVRDEIGGRDFLRFMRMTAKRRPTLYREVFQHLTPQELTAWSAQLARLVVTQWGSR